MLADGGGVGEQALVLDAAEIFALEQFRRQDHARALPRRLTHQARHIGDGDAESRGDRNGGEIERNGDSATAGERGPEADTVPQQRRDHEEHRQRGQHIPQRRLRMVRQSNGVTRIVPQPDHAEHRDERQRRHESARRRAAPRDQRHECDDDTRHAGPDQQSRHAIRPGSAG
ncbi:hypothetical protein WR25_12806 [Diploscapter pachys]|uniref:Uncharacterized protein n=1 Tax=Diploscapter pachys TaxID=2018661 RepID=A0A2A2M4Q3_9BILA|nr:hypothetical protein WR25_12806 [Diploscapter pachys]